MGFTLNDVLAAPTDPLELQRHLLTNGMVPPPPPPEPAQPAIPAISAAAPIAHPRPLTPLDKDLMVSATAGPRAPKPEPGIGALPAAPDLGAGAGAGVAEPMGAIGSAPAIPKLGFKDQMALPTTSAGVAPGSAGYYRNQAERQDLAKENPWGSAENHPGTIGKIGHVLGKIGNIAGDIIAPGITANIPGTDLNKQLEHNQTLGRLAGAEEREARASTEAAKEKHEETTEDQNQVKLDQLERKLDETERKDMGTRELGLRKQGLKLNPDDPNGAPIPLTREDMSPNEQAVLDLKTAQTNSQQAKAALDQIKADPNSPQSKATLARIQIMAQNAGTAAEKLGLDKKKFVADYYGLDENGQPLAGVQVTPEGKPVGPKIAGTTQKALSELNNHYVVPANNVEKSFQMADEAYKEYKAAAAKGQELPTGAQAMVELSTHLSTTFGNVKGARITKDLIEHHLHARSVSDDALVAIQKLTNGDPLSPTQWDAFHDLIGKSRKLSWTTAAREARRANLPVNFLPDDLNDELGGAAPAAPGGGGAPAAAPGGGGGAPNFKDWHAKKTAAAQPKP
jgi:hypothetical protein